MATIVTRAPADFLQDGLLERPDLGSLNVECRFDPVLPTEIGQLGDVFVVQRFLTVARRSKSITLVWTDWAIDVLQTTPGAAVLFACACQLMRVTHVSERGNAISRQRLVSLQQVVAAHRLEPNWFDSTDSVVCSENGNRGWHRDLYSSPGELRPRQQFERLFDLLIKAKVTGLQNESTVLQWKDALLSVVYELFENTHIHARWLYDRVSVDPEVLRVIVVRLITASTGANEDKIKTNKRIACLEFSVLDSGIGFFGARYGRSIELGDDLRTEWQNLRACLDAHVDDAVPKGHRGIGLYEVLRALLFLNGAIQVRSGRTFGYRSFFPFDYRQQMEPRDSKERPGMPKGRLLDFNDPYRPTPTVNAQVRGVAARTLVPLDWQ